MVKATIDTLATDVANVEKILRDLQAGRREEVRVVVSFPSIDAIVHLLRQYNCHSVNTNVLKRGQEVELFLRRSE